MRIGAFNYPFTDPDALSVNITKGYGSSSVVVQWDLVDDSPTTAYIIFYTVTWTRDGTNFTQRSVLILQQTFTITGLTLDTVYTITVTARHECGYGPEHRTSVSLTVIISTVTASIAPVTVATYTTTTSITNTFTSTAQCNNPAFTTSKCSNNKSNMISLTIKEKF